MLIKSFLILLTLESATAFMCPNQTESTAPCNRTVLCEGLLCYANVSDSTGTTGYCCDPKFCADTRLDSYSEKNDDDIHKWEANLLTAKGWIGRDMGNNIKVTCPIPITAMISQGEYDFLSLNEKYPYNQDARWSKDGKVAVTPCQNNSECEYLNDETYTGYCFNSRNPTKITGVDTIKFCYKLKNINNSTEFFVKPDASGFKFCLTNSECRDTDFQGATYDPWFCYNTKKFVAANGANLHGICIRSKTCPGEHLTYVTLPSTGDKCITDDSCANVGPATPNLNPRESYTPKCVNTKVEQSSRFLCCQERLPSCRIGETVVPRVACNTTIDCNQNKNVNNFAEHNKWCDSKDKTCCESKTDHNIVYCPDEATPLRFERKCEGYKIEDPKSGSCPNGTIGICRLGHCCPSFFKKIGATALSTYSFKTQQKCDSSNIVPKRFVFAYCDRENNSVVVIGRKDFNGKDWVNTDTTCKTNIDCSDSEVCVYHDHNTHYCYGFEKKSPSQVDQFFEEHKWKILVAVIVVIIIVLVCLKCYFNCCGTKGIEWKTRHSMGSNMAKWCKQFYKNLDMDVLNLEIEEWFSRMGANTKDDEGNPETAGFTAKEYKLPLDTKYYTCVPPTPAFMKSFLDNIVKNKIKTIVVLGDMKKLDKELCNYLKDNKYDGFHIRKVIEKKKSDNVCHTKFELFNDRSGSKISISHYQLLDWIDGYPPADVKSFLKMYKILRKVMPGTIGCNLCCYKVHSPVLIQDSTKMPTLMDIFFWVEHYIQRIALDKNRPIVSTLGLIHSAHKFKLIKDNISMVYWMIYCITEVLIDKGVVKREKKMDLIKEKYHSTRAANIKARAGNPPK